jgi:bifunctional DNA-binding transcriptional regulator/antitoxin component of YhaV-PrlF toxin-antitoxin module
MPLVKVGPRGQVTIPNQLRKQTKVTVGSFLEAEVRHNVIILKPVKVVDLVSVKEVEAALEEGLRDYREGRVSPPFKNMREFKAHLRKKTR